MIKFLADVNIEKPIVDFLQKNGYDVIWIPDYDCSMSDEDLLSLAVKGKRILLTNDKDFGELVFMQKRLSSGIILFRVHGQQASDKTRLFKKLLMSYKEKIPNHFVVITNTKFRFSPIKEIK